MEGRRAEKVQARGRTDRTRVKEWRVGSFEETSKVKEQRGDGQTRRRRNQSPLHQPRAEKLPASDAPETWWDIYTTIPT